MLFYNPTRKFKYHEYNINVDIEQNFKYMHLKILDYADEMIHEHFADTYNFIDEAIANGGKVLVHWYALIITLILTIQNINLDQSTLKNKII